MSVDPKAGYYTRDGIEAVDVLRAFATPEEFRGWCKCEAILHLLRGPWKGDERRDVEKAATLAAWLAGEHQAPPPERSAAAEARHGKSAWETHPETEALDIMAATSQMEANNASPAGYCGDGGVCKLLRSTRGAQFCQRGECKEASL